MTRKSPTSQITVNKPTRVPISSPKASEPTQSLFGGGMKKHPSTTKNASPRIDQRPATAVK